MRGLIFVLLLAGCASDPVTFNVAIGYKVTAGSIDQNVALESNSPGGK